MQTSKMNSDLTPTIPGCMTQIRVFNITGLYLIISRLKVIISTSVDNVYLRMEFKEVSYKR